jgi:3-hydroxybutyryl-CoA dehydrogenase
MGTGIAQVLATAGWHIALHDAMAGAVDGARDRIEASLAKAVAADRMTAAGAATVLGRLRVAADLADAVGEAALVVEAVVEQLGVKRALFADLDHLAPPDAVLATNTSSFQVAEVAEGAPHPERVIGLHFFFPAHVNRLVEVVATPESGDAAQLAFDWMAAAGKVPIRVADAHGFCVNRFLVPMVNEGFRLLDEGVADAATIDAAGRAAFDAPFGPFGVYDLSGPIVTTRRRPCTVPSGHSMNRRGPCWTMHSTTGA